jgi:hypothetical protein
MKAILPARKILTAFFILATSAATAQNDSISSSFNPFAIAGNNYIWFNSYIKASPVTAGTTIYFDDSRIRFTANGTNYVLNVPKSQISFVNASTLPGGSSEFR